MIEKREQYYLSLAWFLIGACTLLRLFYAQGFLLVPDETNYWQWSRHLDWGYHDQAPMIAWAIHLATSMFGHVALAVRLPSILSLFVASIYVVLIAKRWFDARTAWYAALASQSIFLFNVGSLLATADGLQAGAWAGACYHAARAYEENHWKQWIIGGLWFGFGLLSKYTMVLFLPCLLVYALLSKKHRSRMAGIKPYMACLTGLAMFFPVIFWNAAHQWNSVRHVAYIGGANEGFAIHLNYFGDFLASQALLLTPLVFILVCISWFLVCRRYLQSEKWIFSYLLFTSFPVVAGFGLLSLHTRIYGNWPGAGYVTAVVLVAAFWSPARRVSASGKSDNPATSKMWWWSIGSAYLLTALVLIHVLVPYLPVSVGMDRAAAETRGWDLLGEKVGAVQQHMPNPTHTFVFGFRYQIASELAFYMPGQPMTVSINRWGRPNVYDYWWHDSDLIGWDAVGVTRDADARSRLMTVFEHVENPEPFEIFRAPLLWQKERRKEPPVATHYIYRCYGFKGGLRWIPPNEGDIRAVD